MTYVYPNDISTVQGNLSDLVNSCGTSLSTAVQNGDPAASNLKVVLGSLQEMYGIALGLSPDAAIVDEGNNG